MEAPGAVPDSGVLGGSGGSARHGVAAMKQ